MTIQRNKIAIKRVSDELTKEGNAMQRKGRSINTRPCNKIFLHHQVPILFFNFALLRDPEAGSEVLGGDFLTREEREVRTLV